MLDIKKIKENPDAVKAGLRAKEVDCDATVDRILELDGKIRALKTNTETQTAQKNKLAKENGKLFGMKKKAEKEGKDVSELDAAIAANNAQSVQIAEAIEQELTELKTLSDEYRVAMLSLPNLPDPDLKPGGKENNEPLRYFGEPHKFDFTPKHHVDLCEGLGLIDYDRGVKLAGSGFWMYKDMGARLEWALLNYFIDCHIADGYEFILPPHMLEYQCGETAGQFPKFADEVYKIANPTDDRVHYMLRSLLHLPGRDSHRSRAAPEVLRLHPLLPPGGRFRPRRRAGHGARPPVQQGGNVPVHPPRGFRRGL